jgi:polyisoprenoid-binding protein YceI
MKKLQIIAFLFVGAVAFTSCEKAPKSDEAKTGDAKKVDSSKNAEAKELKLNLATSSVTWVGTKPTGKHDGNFGIKEGVLSVKDGKIVGGKFVVDVTSLKVLDIPAEKEENGKLAGHLKSPDFFDVAKFPTATFEVVSVEAYKADANAKTEEKDKEYTLENPTHTVTGNLELKGVKKSISFPAVVSVDGDKVQANAKFNINRKDWGMEYGADEAKMKDKFIRPTVHIGFNISTAVAN